MSRTLFSYIFKDLFRIFMLASGALAGIMSFGGLLRPLTREGLDAGQVMRMLAYFGPAMTTYSFPVAALFATAVVYGRLAADNELTAFKAGGISLLSLSVAGPALVLGLIVAITSLLFLCFIVPASTLQVEKVIYSNLAKLVQSRIERTHEIDLQQTTIFAQEAHVIPPDSSTPAGKQRVELIGPEIVSMGPDKFDKRLRAPREFYTATRAFVYIDTQGEGEQVSVMVKLIDGFKFPRQYEGATEAGVEETVFGPIQIPSPIKEDVKFMSIWRLKELYRDLATSRRLQAIIGEFVKNGQKKKYLEQVNSALNAGAHVMRFNVVGSAGSPGLMNVLSIDPRLARDMRALTSNQDFTITIPDRPIAPPAASAPMPAAAVDRPVTFRQQARDGSTLVFQAHTALVRAQPSADAQTAEVTVELLDFTQTKESAGGKPDPLPPRFASRTRQTFDVALSEPIRALAGQNIAFYERPDNAFLGEPQRLRREKVTVINTIIAECNGRASFAISCLILVMLGTALGMMFRSGNFLTAFAVSFIPALISITLIIAGQRMSGNLPLRFDGSNNTLKLGLGLIWAGNAVNLVMAVVLLWRLQRR